MELFSSCDSVNIIVWMHHSGTKNTPGEKARWELHKNAMYCFE